MGETSSRATTRTGSASGPTAKDRPPAPNKTKGTAMDSKIELPTPISTDGPPIDVPLLRKAVEWAEAEAAKPQRESEWFQGSYATSGQSIGRECGTAFCIAGYIAHLDGLWPELVGRDVGRLADGRRPDDHAAERLGLTGDGLTCGSESFQLFDGNNSIADVRHVAERIAARAGERL